MLPLAVHNKWVVLHDPRGLANVADVLLLVGGRTDTATRERLYEDVARRLPELLNGLRLRAVQAGLASAMTNRDKGFRRSARRVPVCQWRMIRFKAPGRAGVVHPAPGSAVLRTSGRRAVPRTLGGPHVMTQIHSTRSGKETECDDSS